MKAEDVVDYLSDDALNPEYAAAIRALIAERDALRFDVENYARQTTAMATEMEALRAERDALREALENLVIGIGMGWDLDGMIEVARAALERKP